MQKEASLFKVLAEPLRLRLAVLLASQGEVCVCHLAQALNEPDFKISKHLGVMRAAGMVEVRRQGTWMYYKMAAAKTGLDKCLQKCFSAEWWGTIRSILLRNLLSYCIGV